MRSTGNAGAGRGFERGLDCGHGLRVVCSSTALLEPKLERGDGDAVDDLGAERISEEVARRSVGKPAAGQIEHRLAVELADGGAMRALDVVGENLELRLGVDVRFRGQQQVAARLRRVGALGVRAHDDLAVEHRVRGTASDAFVQLAADAVRLRVVDAGMGVGELALPDQREPVDRALGAFGRMEHIQVVPGDPRTKRDADRPIAARIRE